MNDARACCVGADRQDAEELTRLNRDILRYNLMAPSGVPRKALLAPDS